MTGVCTGKVRSTPTPKLTLRTVKVSRIPPPWRRMTAPWKTWIRERLPSTTRTCTFRVSPGRKSGTSLRSDSASKVSRVFMAKSLPYISWQNVGSILVASAREGGPALGGQPHDDATARRRKSHRPQLCGSEQVGAAPFGAFPRLRSAPAGDLTMMPRQQHRRHVEPAPGRRLGVGRRLEQAFGPGAERVVGRRLGVAEHTRQQPGDCL